MDYDWREVLDFWFGPLDRSGLPDAFHRKRWFARDSAFDAEMRQRFLPLVTMVGSDGLVAWRDHAEGMLAQIVVLDQFTRNVYRGTSRAFDHDGLAMELAQWGVAKGLDRPLPLIFKAFFYMPFQHSEILADQDQGVELFQTLVDAAGPERESTLRGFLASAQEHRGIIAQFGRFPHRNGVLQRTSSEEELAYLRQAGKRFGQ